MSPGKREPRNLTEVDPDSFGGVLRHYRTEAGLSQEELGEIVGLNQSRLSSYERGQNVPEREDIIIALANALNVAPGILRQASGRARSPLVRNGGASWRG